MNAIADRINAVHREVGNKRLPGGEGRTTLLHITYDAPIAEVWDACTNPDRLRLWFLPVTGDLRPGGSYGLPDGTTGTIHHCEPPTRLEVTWEYNEDVSEVELRLASETSGMTAVELEHTAVVDPDFWTSFGPGATGVGWDTSLFGLAEHLTGAEFNEETWQHTPQGREFLTLSSQAWGRAHQATGADPAKVAAAVRATTEFYAPR